MITVIILIALERLQVNNVFVWYFLACVCVVCVYVCMRLW